jgi:hypothetical protein
MQQSPFATAHVAIGVLLKRQVDVETDAVFAARTGIGRLHHAAAGAGEHRKPGSHGLAGHRLGQGIDGIRLLGPR